MFTPSFEAIFALLTSLIIAIMGYLIRRSIFTELDALKKEVHDMQLSKVDSVSCGNRHTDLKEDLCELKEMARANVVMIQRMAIDLAVVKTKVNGVE